MASVTDPYTLTPEQVLKTFNVKPENGLSEVQVSEQKTLHGSNGKSLPHLYHGFGTNQ